MDGGCLVAGLVILVIVGLICGGINWYNDRKLDREIEQKAYQNLYKNPHSSENAFKKLNKPELAHYAAALYDLKDGYKYKENIDKALNELAQISDDYNGKYADAIAQLKAITAARQAAMSQAWEFSYPQGEFPDGVYSSYMSSLESYGYDNEERKTITADGIQFELRRITAYYDEQHSQVLFSQTFMYTQNDDVVWKITPCFSYRSGYGTESFYDGYKGGVVITDPGKSKARTPGDIQERYNEYMARIMKEKAESDAVTAPKKRVYYDTYTDDYDDYDLDMYDSWEDFYDDNYDDFESIDDAEDYWDEHHK